MTAEDAIHYHGVRAGQERERARDSASKAAANAHLALAELHEEQARAFGNEAEHPRRKLHAAFARVA